MAVTYILSEVPMKKLGLLGIILLVILQTVLAVLKVSGVLALRWLWVLTPLWLIACLLALGGMYMVLKSRSSDGSHQSKKH